MLKERHCRALFLIDEFGKGTAEADGTALLVR
jgi:DNA mismatch repair ATPase MutS